MDSVDPIDVALQELTGGGIAYRDFGHTRALIVFEDLLEAEPEMVVLREERPTVHSVVREDLVARRPTRQEWLVGLTDQFRKCIKGIDRKLQGRKLDAIAEVSNDPTTPRGNSVSKMKHRNQNLWRYRLGNFRMVYEVDESVHQVTLLTMQSRGSVYLDS